MPAPRSDDPLRPTDDLAARLDRLGLEFLAEFHETALRHRPAQPELLSELGQVYTRLGRFAEGLAVDRELVTLVPDNPTVHYNLACSLALSGRPGEALDALEQAVRLGYDDDAFLESDEDLTSLRSEPRFLALVDVLRRRARQGGARD